MWLIQLIKVITLVLGVSGALVGVFAVVDAAVRRPDAFAAADKLTKGAWMAITGFSAGVLILGVPQLFNIFPPQTLIWLLGIVGALVYLLDVRPRLREVTDGRSNNW